MCFGEWIVVVVVVEFECVVCEGLSEFVGWWCLMDCWLVVV